jgi:hypothetical protein
MSEGAKNGFFSVLGARFSLSFVSRAVVCLGFSAKVVERSLLRSIPEDQFAFYIAVQRKMF